MSRVVFVVTCEQCGQSWQRSAAVAEQVISCIFCGNQGRLQLGPKQYGGTGIQHVEAWLQRARTSPP